MADLRADALIASSRLKGNMSKWTDMAVGKIQQAIEQLNNNYPAAPTTLHLASGEDPGIGFTVETKTKKGSKKGNHDPTADTLEGHISRSYSGGQETQRYDFRPYPPRRDRR